MLRSIGGEGVTNYPIGVGINAQGEVVVADNHNNFNLTVFTQDGQLISAFESKVCACAPTRALTFGHR
jgi:tripartite motif-containing protein 2/3